MSFIGYSEGGSIIFSALAENDNAWKEHINMVIGLGPAVYLSNTKKDLKDIA